MTQSQDPRPVTQARDLLESEFRRAGRHFTADEIAADDLGQTCDLALALRAIEAALSRQSASTPEGERL